MAQFRFDEYGGNIIEHQREVEWLMCRAPRETPVRPVGSLAYLPDGSLVGMVLTMRLPLAFKGDLFEARNVICVQTRADQRGRGLYTRLAETVCAESLECGARVIIGTPNASATGVWRKLGHNFALPLKFANQPLLLLAWFSNKLPVPSFVRAPWLDDIVSRALPKLPLGPYTVLDSLEDVQFEPAIDPDRLTLHADAAWLDWRYLQSPRHYTLLAIGNRSRPDAIAIVRTASNKSADGSEVLYGLLMDVIRSSSAPCDAQIEAAYAGIAWLRERRCHSVKSLFVPGTSYEALLSKVHFQTKRRYGEAIYITSSDQEHRLPTNFDAYAITASWTDWM
jgi:hypothetical protein